ncbi:MAG: hypothetical protein WCA51_04705 [Dehalococcoidia bacterium]
MNNGVAKKKRVTNEMLEAHLKKQDVEFARSLWFALMAFTGSIVITGGIFYLSTKDPGIVIYGLIFFLAILILYLRASKKLK